MSPNGMNAAYETQSSIVYSIIIAAGTLGAS